MLFHSPEFIVLMLATLGLYVAVPRARIPILAAANVLFYVVSGWQYLLLFLGMMAFTHWMAVLSRGPHARLWLWLGVAVNLVNLGIFKYTGFAVSNLERLLHVGLDPARFQLILPVGISFYTFQLIAYLVDVYKGDIPPARNLLQFWVFIAFFGQLIAGPIMRGKDFLPQVEQVTQLKVTWSGFKYGVYLFLLGLTKKVIFSDMLGPRADSMFGSWWTLNGLEAWIAGMVFGFQIYFDFSAYSEMALGIGHMFGMDLSVNFRTPYLSGNPSEFWRRWHITLSSFIRDYIYIPLGGSRKGEARAYLNMVVGMVLSGLWHGAAWTFVAWGLYHGALSAAHKFWTTRVIKRSGLKLEGRAVRWLSVTLMFLATTVGWVFFRADGLTAAVTMIRRMFSPGTWAVTPMAARYLPILALLALLHVVEFWWREKEWSIADLWHQWVPSPVRALVYTLAGSLLLILTETEQVSFIYFRF